MTANAPRSATASTSSRRHWLRTASRGPLALALAGALTGLAACDRPGGAPAQAALKFNAVDITGAEYAREFSMPDAEGKLRTLADFKGKVVVIFFGYTQCPDVCPTTMVEMAEARKLMGPAGDQVQVIFVTVDPERDTPDLLRNYVKNFGADNVALRGSPEQLKAMAREFKVIYAKVPGRTDDSYTMDHTAGTYVIDPQGRVRLFMRYGGGPKPVAEDLLKLLK